MAGQGALLSVYLDTSFFVPLFVREEASDNARSLAQRWTRPLLVSSWTLTEFASALAFKKRLGAIDLRQWEIAHNRAGDAIASGLFREEPVLHADFEDAAGFFKPDGPPLRAGDSLHLAVCRRLGRELATYDGAMRAAAAAFGIPIKP